MLGFQVAPSGGLAVDFFFLLSGFVIAHAYEGRLLQGMTLGAFLRVRLKRLYPVYALGLAIGVAVIVGLFVAGDPAFPLWQPVMALGAAIVFLPMVPSIYSATMLYPLNMPAWSLAVEMFVNLLYAAFVKSLSDAVLSAVAIVALGTMLLVIGQSTIEGYLWPTIEHGYLRALFSFPLGILIYRHRERLPRPLPLIVPLMALTGCLCLKVSPDWLGTYQMIFMVTLAPAILIAALGPVAGAGVTLSRYLGRTSYPIYALHFPALMLAGAGAKFFGIDERGVAVALVAVLLTTCWWIDLLDERWRKAKRPGPLTLTHYDKRFRPGRLPLLLLRRWQR
jgi:peptidoglycan/LPS O-acetylase OafA/YrhL